MANFAINKQVSASVRHSQVLSLLIPLLLSGVALSRSSARLAPGTRLAEPLPKAATLAAQQPTLDASSFELDGPGKSLVLTDVRVSTQNGYVIKAGEAHTADMNNFQNSHWVFNNKVEITTPQGHSNAETANVSFAQNQISELHMVGSPATFEQYDASKQIVARGHAGAIDYDLKQSTVRLSNDAWINYGPNECRAATLVYNIGVQRISAKTEEQNGQRVNCTISPATGNPSSATPAPDRPVGPSDIDTPDSTKNAAPVAAHDRS